MNDILNKICLYRNNLMGFAILWILSYHAICFVKTNCVLCFPFLIGYMGVDIFLFLSGFGIYYALSKQDDLFEFYKRRLKRILPIFPIICILTIYFLITQNLTFHQIIGYLTTLYFWVNPDNCSFSYIGYLLFFYLLSPIFKNIIDNSNKHYNSLLILFIVLFIWTILFWESYNILKGVIRIFPFVIGMYAGYISYHQIKISTERYHQIVVFSIISLLLIISYYIMLYNQNNTYALRYYLVIGFIPGFIFVLAKIFNYVKFKLNLVFKIFNNLGKHSLEIYALDAINLKIISTQNFGNNFFKYIVISLFIAYIYIWMYIYNKILRVNKNG